MRLRIGLLLAAAVAASFNIAFGATISPGQVTQVVAFGDSLSDAGNASIATLGAIPGPGYATRTVTGVPFPVGYFTNPQTGTGPSGLWIDQFAAKLGVADPSPALAPLGGSNYAVGSAMTGSANLADMQNQVNLFLATHPGSASPTALYTLWGGANDIFGAQNPVTAADNIATQIKELAADGGQNFLWFNLPSLGETPALSGIPAAAAAANFASQAFDQEWALQVANLDSLGINVIGVNIDTLFNEILANPVAFGFNNVVAACNATPRLRSQYVSLLGQRTPDNLRRFARRQPRISRRLWRPRGYTRTADHHAPGSRRSRPADAWMVKAQSAERPCGTGRTPIKLMQSHHACAFSKMRE